MQYAVRTIWGHRPLCSHPECALLVAFAVLVCFLAFHAPGRAIAGRLPDDESLWPGSGPGRPGSTGLARRGGGAVRPSRMLRRVHGRMVQITKSEYGGSLVEYVLLVACIALASFGAASLFGTSLGQLFQAVAAVMP